MIRMSLAGMAAVQATIRSLPRAVQKEVDDALDKGARIISRDIITSIKTGPRTGRVYGSHVASATGEPPASLSGELANSIYSRKAGNCSYEIVASAPHSGFLEFGTRKMDPRPYMRPAMKRGKALIKFLVKSAIARGLKRISKGKGKTI